MSLSLVLLFTVCSLTTLAQVHEIQAFTKLAPKPELLSSSFSVADSQDVINDYSSIGSYLQARSPYFIKESVPGLLATASVRGGDAYHQLITLNGARLNSPMLGSLDFNTIGTGGLTKAEIYAGASGGAFGYGSLTGGLALSAEADTSEDRILAQARYGSFNTAGGMIEVNSPFILSDKRGAWQASLVGNYCENNFRFTNLATPEPFETDTMDHAETMVTAVNASGTWHATNRLQLNVLGWLTVANRMLPLPQNITRKPAEFQNDTLLWLQAGAKATLAKNLTLQFTQHAEWNVMRYADTIASITNRNHYRSHQSLLGIGWQAAPRWTVKFQANAEYSAATSANYKAFPAQSIFSPGLQVAYDSRDSTLRIELGTRAHWQPTIAANSPYAGVLWRPWQSWQFFVNGGRNVRPPTLNELYWQPGGNTSLAPEQGLMGEGGLKFIRGELSLELAAFYNDVQNRVRWLPTGSYFSPQNVLQSRASGADASVQFLKKRKIWRTSVFAAGSFTQATNRFDTDDHWRTTIYAPRISIKAGGDLGFRNHLVGVSSVYVGKRFTNTTASEYLPHYFLIHAFYLWEFKKLIAVRFGVSNLFDYQYQVVAWRAMPGRAFNIEIQFTH